MLYLIDLESVETRYTVEWKKYLPLQLESAGISTTVISGDDVVQTTTPGAFLNFAGTNIYKSQQIIKIAELFASDKIQDGDYFLFTDFWNPVIIQLKYMSSLLNKKIRIGSLIHAGSYDKNDFLGRLIGAQPWVRNAEQSLYDCCDHIFFATQDHIDLFNKHFLTDPQKTKLVGWPMEYLDELIVPLPKENIILFPHRLAPEKQLEIFKDLAESFPEYRWIVCQENKLSKQEYRELLGKSVAVFSANLQETLGISMYEALLAGSRPIVPDRLSYSEMYSKEFVYPSIWTENWENYQKHKPKIVKYLQKQFEKNDQNFVFDQTREFFSGKRLYDVIKNS